MSDLKNSDNEIENLKQELCLLKSELVKANYKLQDLQKTIDWIETSKFWKLRTRIVQFKQKYQNIFLITKTNKILRRIRKLFNKYVLQTEKIRYKDWMNNHRISNEEINSADLLINNWKNCHTFSIIMPVYNVDVKWLKKAIDSVINQIYPHWELCIADDNSNNRQIRELLNEYSKNDPRIKVIFRTVNGNISAASNSALELATGEYIALLDHDDELAINALFENAKLINSHPDADFIYSDEDKINTTGKRFAPFFKPDWSPDLLYGCMYTCHLSVYRTSLVRQLGGFRSEYDGSQDYDLALRIVEKTQNIYHIPQILYHWRVLPSSAASTAEAKPWAYIAGQKALEDMVARNRFPGYVEATKYPGRYRVRYQIVDNPKISIIIPSAGKIVETSKGFNCLLKSCIDSIQQLSTYKNFEILIVDGYDIPASIISDIINDNIRLVRCDEPFNFSHRINQGVDQANGEFLLLLNDDVEILSPDWLESMLELAQQDRVAAVGAKLIYPNRTIQHIGVVIPEIGPLHVFAGFADDDIGYFGSSIINKNYLAVTGACLMIERELFVRLGRLDRDFPLNYNDVDLCLKAHQAGYRNVVTPYAQLIHYESATRKPVVQSGEINYFHSKWNRYLQSLGGDPYYNSNFCKKSANFEL